MTLITHLLDPIIDALGRVTLLFGVTFVFFDDLSDPLLIEGPIFGLGRSSFIR